MTTNSPPFDDRTERLIKTLTPTAQTQSRTHLTACRAAGIDARIISGTRTAAEQNALFGQGRTKPGDIVTKSRAWQSNHNYGIAWDIGIFEGHDYLEESPLYAKVGAIGAALGLDWGGLWVSFKDFPHTQCRTGKSVSELRSLVAAHDFDLAAAIAEIDALIKPLKTQAFPDAPKPWGVTVNGKSIGGVVRDGAGVTLVPARVFLSALRGEADAKLLGTKSGVFTYKGQPLRETDGDTIPVRMFDGVGYAEVRPLSDALKAKIAPLQAGGRVVVVTG